MFFRNIRLVSHAKRANLSRHDFDSSSMSRLIRECNALLQNNSIPFDCTATPAGTPVCCIGQCCFVTRRKKEFWENWYFWFVVVLMSLLLMTSLFSYLAGSCKKKRHNLIRIHHVLPPSADQHSTSVSVISDADGIIQPRLSYITKSRYQDQNASHTALDKQNSVDDFIKPLSPAYPPIQPVTIVRGNVPPMGFRQTSNYTELVLPPGFVDTGPAFKT
ncbi:uncharacterized protein [Bemisia tabaci]|uniref:uncharacterized protein isoform X1 n=1 Tax=Bemisia tabaci TaxID=7038 RepID=UPI0008F9D672|nr:PREDICTED: uncharacterized protein LOC109030658 isoform X1 [Bemisia tabaci]XP_018897289.1 PREDICTED: uncharacterized protein LOC109030658 isoform X1 [Bemisia tabaci]